MIFKEASEIKWMPSKEMGTATRVHSLDDTEFHLALMPLENELIPLFFLQLGYIERQTGFFKFGMTTSLRKGNI